MASRARISRKAIVNGHYYKTNEIINKGYFEVLKWWQNNSVSGDSSGTPQATTIPALNFDLSDLTRANKIKDEFQWFRFKRCVLRVRPAQNGTFYSAWYAGSSCVNGDPNPVPPDSVLEPPNFVTFFDGDGSNKPPKSYNNAVIRPYSKLHSFHSKYGFARAFTPKIVRDLTIGKNDATEMSYDKKYTMPWLPLNVDAPTVEIYGPQMYIPAYAPDIPTPNPKFIVTISVEVEFKGQRVQSI